MNLHEPLKNPSIRWDNIRPIPIVVVKVGAEVYDRDRKLSEVWDVRPVPKGER